MALLVMRLASICFDRPDLCDLRRHEIRGLRSGRGVARQAADAAGAGPEGAGGAAPQRAPSARAQGLTCKVAVASSVQLAKWGLGSA